MRSDFICRIYNFVDCLSNFECIWVHLFANLTLESLPIKWPNILVLGAWWFFLLLSNDPTFQALEMNESYSTFTLTSYDERIWRIIFVTPANSTLYIFRSFVFQIFSLSNFQGLSQFLMVQFFLWHLHEIAFEIFNSKSNSS
jgi:hypothetical protein